jgi:transposase
MSRQLGPSSDTNYYLYRRPVKMNLSFDGLEKLVRTELNKDVLHGDVFIFMNRPRSMLKIFE